MNEPAIVINVPMLPPPELSLNYPRYAHWGTVAQARKAWHNAVGYSAIDARNRITGWQPIEFAELELTFIYPVRRKRDADNLITMFKKGQDALVDAKIILSDDTEHLTIRQPVIIIDEKRSPQTIIRVFRR